MNRRTYFEFTSIGTLIFCSILMHQIYSSAVVEAVASSLIMNQLFLCLSSHVLWMSEVLPCGSNFTDNLLMFQIVMLYYAY